MKKRQAARSTSLISQKYQEVLASPKLPDEEIGRLRAHVRLLAQAICEHVWRRKVY